MSTITNKDIRENISGESQNHKETQLKVALQCPVCQDCPRQSPIHNCQQGHLLCNECYEEIKNKNKNGKNGIVNCPLCREPLIGKSLLAEHIIENILCDALTECRYKPIGCNEVNTMKKLIIHKQNTCTFRTVQCPGCTEKGPINSIVLTHIPNSTCADVIIYDRWPATYIEPIIDEPHPKDSVFKDKEASIHYAPTLLTIRHNLSFIPYLTVRRLSTGQWYFTVKGIGTSETRSQFRAKISIEKCVQSNPEEIEAPHFAASLNIHDSQDELSKIIERGSYIMLTDEQIKNLQSPKSIFRYSITITRVSNSNG